MQFAITPFHVSTRVVVHGNARFFTPSLFPLLLLEIFLYFEVTLSESTVVMERIQLKAVELEGMEARENNDDKDMARLGKNPILKVCRPTYFHRRYL